MKNRVLENRRRKEKIGYKDRFYTYLNQLFCTHSWEVFEPVGRDWDLIPYLRIKCKCKFCGLIKQVRNNNIEEIPDDKIDNCIGYY